MRKTAFITGGATGIGKETAKKLCEDGFFVVVFCNKSEKDAIKLCEKLNEKEFNSCYIKADLSDFEEVKKAVNEAIKITGSVDILVNNAGIAQQKLFSDITCDDWHTMMNVNLNSVFYMCKEIVPLMIKNKCGKIINISSMWGICGASCEVHYSASKAAVIGFTKALAQELGPSNIQVNCIAPGVIDTKMNACFSDEDIEALKSQTPLGRIGKPSDISELISFLASDKADFITGQIISPNGGFLV